MTVRNVPIDDVIVGGSRFSLNGFLCADDLPFSGLEESFRDIGIVQPVVLQKNGGGRFDLVDGRRRISFAQKSGASEVSAVVLPETTPVADILIYMLGVKRDVIGESVVNKAGFVSLAASLGEDESWMRDRLCVLLGFRPYRDLLKDCRRIHSLPQSIKLFCHEKKYSLKQALNLAHCPSDILLQLMEWKEDLQLTASVLDEMVSNIRDCLRANTMGLKEFLEDAGIQEIMRSRMSPRERTESLRTLIRLKRFPVLSEMNAAMDRTVEHLKLPPGISVAWDRTLENRNVDVTVHMSEAEKFEGLLKILGSPEMKRAVEQLLERL